MLVQRPLSCAIPAGGPSSEIVAQAHVRCMIRMTAYYSNLIINAMKSPTTPFFHISRTVKKRRGGTFHCNDKIDKIEGIKISRKIL